MRSHGFKYTAVFTTTFALLLLAGCESAAIRDPSSPYFRIPVGSTLILHHELRVPAHHARVFLQSGQMLPGGGFNSYHPHCAIQVRDVLEQPQIIHPDEFRIDKVRLETEQVVGRDSVLLAAAGIGGAFDMFFGIGMRGDSDSGVSDIYQGYTLFLSSSKQANVMSMTCLGVFAAPVDAMPPTLLEIREALGDYATIKLP